MGQSADAELVWGVVVYDEEGNVDEIEPYDDWPDLPDYLDFSFGGSPDWAGACVIYLKAARTIAREYGVKQVALDEMMTAVEQHQEGDQFEDAVAWCEKHKIEWCQADWLLIASFG